MKSVSDKYDDGWMNNILTMMELPMTQMSMKIIILSVEKNKKKKLSN